jgi:hypothetical protein
MLIGLGGTRVILRTAMILEEDSKTTIELSMSDIASTLITY